MLDIIGESASARALVDEHKKDLLLSQDLVRSYHEIEKELLKTPEFESTAQGRITTAFVRAIAEETVTRCESESPAQTAENQLNCFSQACARSREQEALDFESMVDVEVITDCKKNAIKRSVDRAWQLS